MTPRERLEAQIAKIRAKLAGADDDTWHKLIIRLDKLRTRRYRLLQKERAK